MKYITDVAELAEVYPTPSAGSLRKVATSMTPAYRKWISASKFCALTSVGPEGTDCSPRGDVGAVVRELDAHHLAMPDWQGNNRMDSLRNIILDGRVSIMFMLPGSDTIVRVNGSAKLTRDAGLCGSFAQKGRHPRSVIVIKIAEMYFQCSRAPMRAGLWSGIPKPEGLPTAGDFLKESTDGEMGGEQYDIEWPERAEASLW